MTHPAVMFLADVQHRTWEDGREFPESSEIYFSYSSSASWSSGGAPASGANPAVIVGAREQALILNNPFYLTIPLNWKQSHCNVSNPFKV